MKIVSRVEYKDSMQDNSSGPEECMAPGGHQQHAHGTCNVLWSGWRHDVEGLARDPCSLPAGAGKVSIVNTNKCHKGLLQGTGTVGS